VANATWLYVGVIYTGGVWLLRRAGADLPWKIGAFFYALTLVFFWQTMTGPYTNVATDVLQLLPPWSAQAPPGTNKFTVSNHAQQDVVMQLVPWAHQVRESWRSLRIPLWNELTGSGFPLIANGQGAALSPLRVAAVPLSLASSIMAEGAFKVLIGLTFTWLYCRRRGYAEVPSAIAALAFGFGPFTIVWLHYAQGTVGCFTPVVFYAIDLLAEGVTAKRFAGAAIVGPLVLFSGHPETAAQILFAAVLYVVWLLLFDTRMGRARFLRSLAGVGAVSVLLSLPFLVPFFEGMTKSVRYRAVELNPYRDIPFSDFPSLVAMIQPRIYGTLPAQVWGPAAAESITGFAGILGIAAWFGTIAHVIATRRFRSREFFFVIATAIMFLTIANWPPVRDVVQLAIGLAPNARLRLLIAWMLCVLIAALLDNALRGDRRNLIVGVVAASAVLAVVLARTNFPDDAATRVAITALAPSALVLGLSVLLLLPPLRRPALLLIATAAIVEMWAVTRPYNPIHHVNTLYPRTPLIDTVLRVHKRQPDRVVGLGPVFFPNTNLIFGLEDVRMLDAMGPARYLELLNLVMPTFDPHDYYPKWTDADSPFLDYLNVRWVMAEPGRAIPDSSRYGLIYTGPDGQLWENRQVLPRFFPARNVLLEFDDAKYEKLLQKHRDWATTAVVDKLPVRSDQERTDLLAARPGDTRESTLTIDSAAPTEYTMRVDAPRYTLIVSSIGWWPAWRATIDGKPLRTQVVNSAFLGFVVPPGAGTIRVYYWPTSVYLSFAVAILTALALVAMSSRTSPGINSNMIRDRV
jgi:hypothetical protein